MRVGILTGGGDCPGLNAAIRAVAKSLILKQKAEIIGVKDGFLGLIEKRTTTISYSDCSGILNLGGTILGTHNRADPFNHEGRDVSSHVKDYYDTLGLDALVVIGGDGSLSIASELAQMDMNIVGVPKTIDNDLMCTDRTFGFDTATSIVTEAIDRLRTTGQSHKRIMILETMGRNAGWIALHSGLAGGADSILIPEHPYNIEEVARICQARSGDKGYALVVVAEGARPQGGSTVVRETIADSPDPIRFGGIGEDLKRQLEKHIDAEVRATNLGHIQRGGTPTSFDRIFATEVGCYAAKMVANGEFGKVAIIRNNTLGQVPLSKVANKTRVVTEEDISYMTAVNMGISFGIKQQ
ncbi:6-phosphofructokinase [Agarilytica rhodophyticola]|uniref:6-phosphofructokinase n=1 Tax=Agarilytica rhodophyticola TaxID=1737490 RepID=UPI000B34241C|nr:ATP-dependent 6-phosphofructokinase [Agarilytica rhodophyticola]